MGKTLRSLLATVLFGFATAASPTVVSFTYTSGASGCAPDTCTDELTGSFAFADSPLSVALADLTAFNLTYVLTDSTVPVTSTFTYGLNDLQSFSATLDAAQNLLTLNFQTEDLVGTSHLLFPLGVLFSFTSTATPNATLATCHFDTTKGGEGEVCSQSTTGALTASSVSEPPVVALLAIALGFAGFGYAGIGYERLKRRRAVHN
jgi:hypothetical protein